MKTCHICEQIVKTLRSTACLTCRRTFCYPCISKHFSQQSDILIPKTQAEALKQLKIAECFCCLKRCRCDKCTVTDSVIVPMNQTVSMEEVNKSSIMLKDSELIRERNLFKQKKISELPNYLLRVFSKKKVIYTKHQLSVQQNENLMVQENQQPDEIENKEVGGKMREDGELVESIDIGAPQQSEYSSKANRMQAQNDNDQADVEADQEASQSQNDSVQPASSKLQAQNEGEGQNEMMVDQNNLNQGESNSGQPEQGFSQISRSSSEEQQQPQNAGQAKQPSSGSEREK